jgi:hypothetical protein
MSNQSQKHQSLELNKTYEFNLGDMSHCDISHNDMIAHYNSNSSPLSFLIEKKLPGWFDDIMYYTKQYKFTHNGHDITIRPDFRDKETKTILYDQKAFNHNGGSFARSSYKGVGRKFDKELNDAWAMKQIFIWTDFCELPTVRVIALTGEECIKRWKSCKISKKDRELLFS